MTNQTNQQLIIYTDGAARGNPGRGGYGIVLIWGNIRRELSGGYRMTTNNRMELLAVIVALEALTREGLAIQVYTDSQYLVNAVEKGWLWNWVKIGFKDKKNRDLWERFIPLYRRHRVKFNWVKGHASNPENNRCDQLATEAADGGNLQVDVGYERGE
ncbi:ribonuclease HI [Chitinophaga sp.]|uniref:ribonuclease HI n=1 Tax=Chitinophaga sp. TaxID=1869181 RepID=UPI002614D00A|nr:ribonuclease HI [uncultured Chitinophaga sp.]